MNTLSVILLQDAAGGGAGLMNILFIIVLFAIFYFFMIRPQSKRQKQINKFRSELKAGDKVITAGGIHGIIKDIKDNAIFLEISKGVEIKIESSRRRQEIIVLHQYRHSEEPLSSEWHFFIKEITKCRDLEIS